MRRITRLIAFVVVLSSLGLGTGCGLHRHREPIVIGSPAMLFDRAPSFIAATDIGRDSWPATFGGLESIEETTFVEYYHDHQGNASQEAFTPHRNFYAYRTGRIVR